MCKDVSGDVLLIGIFSAVFKDWRSVEFGLSAAVFFFFSVWSCFAKFVTFFAF